MLPARVDATVGYLFEQHMLERPKIVTTRPPSAQQLYYTTSIDLAFIEDLEAVYSHYTAIVSGTTVYLDGDYLTYSGSIDAARPYDNPYSYQIMTISGSISNNLLTINSSSYFTWSATGSMVLPACDFWLDSSSYQPATSSITGAVTGYGRNHFVFHRWKFTGRDNLFFNGCLQTINTTPDKGLPFETWEVAPNKLVVVDASDATPRLNVE
jgi:hypothetical protein